MVLSSLAVECLYGDTNLCKLEVHNIIAILIRDVFRTQLNIYDGAFCQNSYRFSAVRRSKKELRVVN